MEARKQGVILGRNARSTKTAEQIRKIIGNLTLISSPHTHPLQSPHHLRLQQNRKRLLQYLSFARIATHAQEHLNVHFCQRPFYGTSTTKMFLGLKQPAAGPEYSRH